MNLVIVAIGFFLISQTYAGFGFGICPKSPVIANFNISKVT